MTEDNNKKITFVTSMNEEGFKLYGQKMLEAVDKYWSKDLQLVCGYHDFDIHEYNPPVSDVISYRNLNLIDDLIDYREQFKKYDGTQFGNGYNWRMDAIKWCHKVFCIAETAFELAEQEIEAGWLCWIDADTLTKAPFTNSDLAPFLNDKVSIVHLGRTATDYSETSFIGFNLNRENPVQFIADFVGAYISGEVLGYREWHDGFIFERLLNIYKAHGTVTHNLTPDAKTLDAFGVSPLSQWMEHFKGNKKLKQNETVDSSQSGVSPDVNGPARYGQLLKIVQHYGVKSVIETGTWNGGRAIQMAEAAFAAGADEFTYTGFDLFEEATEELDAKELNGKPHNTVEAVSKRLEEYASKKEQDGKKFTFTLHKGNTNETLKSDTFSADLAYIDGGHSYETTRNDYDNIHASIVVFDDYFSKDANGNIPHEDHCGTNRVISEVGKQIDENELEWRVKVLPSQDKVREGGHTHLAVVLKDDSLPDLPSDFYRVPIVVTPKDCMPDDYILNNVRTNVANLGYDGWVQTCGLTDDELVIVSGGDVNYETLRIILDNMKADGIGYKVVCVKHSLPKLMKHKIIPDYCVILDPRPVTGESTHGVIRKDLFKKFSKKTTFLVASMTDPSVVELLKNKGAKIKLWHAYSEAIRDKAFTNEVKLHPDANIGEDCQFVTGGTCAAMRTFGMFHILGFRKFHLFGFDCSIPDVSEEEAKTVLDTGQKKYFKVEVNDEIFWTTGELLAMAQDCEKLFDREDIDYKIRFYANGPSLVNAVWQTSKKYKELDYKELI